jgi:flagellar protein FlaJ
VAAVYLFLTAGFGVSLLAIGLCLLPVGYYAFKDDSKVSKIDEEIPTFIRSLGNVAESLGSTVSLALSKIDRRSMDTLEPYIKRLQARLSSKATPKLCWDRFTDETGSELAARTTRMFVDGANLGGSPAKVGQIASEYALTVALLRAKRHSTALPFAYLTVPLHGAMSALLIFILEIMKTFTGKLSMATEELSAGSLAQIPALPIFQVQDLTQITVLTMGAVLVLTIANSLTAKFATGGHNLKIAFFGSIMFILSGLNLIIIPPITQSLLMR